MYDRNVKQKKIFQAGLILTSILLLILVYWFYAYPLTPVSPTEWTISKPSIAKKPDKAVKTIVPTAMDIQPKLQQAVMFELSWGESAPMIGGKGYDPGSGNGISGGAMPLNIQIGPRGDLMIADGYGPRILHFNSSGQLQKVLELPLLRPEHFSQTPALSGFQFYVDSFGRWHILDMEKRWIHIYHSEGLWIQSYDIGQLIEKHYRLHDIHPVLRVAGKDRYFLQVTVSDSDVEIEMVLGNIPVRSTRIIGLWLDACFGFVQELPPEVLPLVYGYDSWHLAWKEQGWLIEQRQWQSDQWEKRIQWQMEALDYQGGDLIGIDHQGMLYWWHGRSEIACLDTLRNQYSIWKLPGYRIYHPVSVHPSGGLVLLEASKQSVQLIRLQLANN